MKKKSQKKRVRRNPVQAKAQRPVQRVAFAQTRDRRPRRQRNPSAKALMSKPIDMLKLGTLAGLALLAARYVPQMALGARNKGILGYLANLGTAAALAALTTRSLGEREGLAVLSGGGAYLVARLATDASPMGKALNLSGVGDPQANGSLGALKAAYFMSTPILDARTGQPVFPRALTQHIKAQIPPPSPPAQPAQGSAGTVGRFAARF